MTVKRRAGAPEVIVAGSVYWDLIFFNLNEPPTLGEEVRTDRFTMTPGGGGYITAVGLARLGVRTALRTYVGRDQLGQLLLDAMRREKLNVSGVKRHPTLGSAISVAFSTTGDRGFLTYKGSAVETGELLRAWKRSAARHVHFAGMRSPFEPHVKLLEQLRREQITTSLDIGWNPEVYADPGFREIVKRVTIFMPSQRDAKWFTGRSDLGEAVGALGEMVRVPVVKVGSEGAVGLEQGRVVTVRPPSVEVVDTTGAGDAFNAGFIWAFVRDEPLERCLLAGNICGAFSTRAPGGTPAFPTLREFRTALRDASP